MTPDNQTLLALLVITGIFIWLWRQAARLRPAATPIGALQRALQRRTTIGSAETTRHTESEQPLRRLPFDLSRPAVFVTRACLVVFYLLALMITLGR